MKRSILESFAIASVLTPLSYIVGLHFEWISQVNWLEVFAVWTCYVSVWMCNVQTRWNYPVGAVTTAAFSILYYEQGAIALALFNLYMVFALTYGWFRWGSDKDTRPVTRIAPFWYSGYAALWALLLIVFTTVIHAVAPISYATLSYIDLFLAVSSGVAQFAMDNKKIESWIMWAIVDIVSIPYFIHIGIPLVAFQYVFFLANTVIGFVQWKRSVNLKVGELA